jgi:plastocyanin
VRTGGSRTVKRGFFVALVTVTALAGSGCASSGTDMEGTVPGGAADPGQATREIVVEASDDLRFDPASIEVEVGDVLTFVVHNVGKIDH